MRAKLRETGVEAGEEEGADEEPLGGSDGRVFQLLVRTRSRGGFHGIIKMFVDVDSEGGYGVAARGWRKRGTK